jgi:leucyl aminopeptidase (aminopeptidase T)
MTPATRVIEEILGVIPGEKFLVVHDSANLDIARAFEQAGEVRGAKVERIDLETLGTRPLIALPAPVALKIRSAQASALAVRSEDGEYALRASFVQTAMAARLRHVHMVGLSRRVFQASMVTPCSRIFELLRKLRTGLRPSSKISVRSSAGTNLEIEMAPHLRWMDNGSAIRPGEWATLPFGSLVSSPANVNGVYVADASLSGPMGMRRGLLSSRPARLTFEGSRLRKVESSDSELREHIERFAGEGQGRERVGMVVLGANVGLMPPTGEFIHDEHTPGVHLGLGENFASLTGATWSAQGQLAFAMASADVDIDGVALIRQGRYVRFV